MPGPPPAPSRRLRVVLAADGTRGDVFPMLALACSLRSRGHEVVLCAPPDNAETARARGVPFRGLGEDVRAYLAEQAARVAGGGWWSLAREMDRYLKRAVPRQLEGLRSVVPGADCVLAGGVQFGAAVVARAHGVAYRPVIYCPALLASEEHPPAVLPLARLPRPLNRLAWRATVALVNRLGRAVLNPHCAALGLPRVRDVYREILSERPILAADRLLAPAPPDSPLPVQQVACLHPLDGWADEPLPPKLEAFLEQGPPPVYLGFGSMPDPDPRATTRLALEAVSRAGCRALLARGWAGLAGGPLPDGVMAVDAVSHAKLFARVAAVVHHGGAGTTTTAARAGAPQVVVPHLLDQVYWAERVRVLGLGPPALPRRRLDARRLANALREACENEVIVERARGLGETLRVAAASAPEPWEWVERLAQAPPAQAPPPVAGRGGGEESRSRR